MTPDAPDTIWVVPRYQWRDGRGYHAADIPNHWPSRTSIHEQAEYARVTPLVRLARWEDGHPERYTSTDKVGGFWRAIAWDEDGEFTRRTGGTRDEARAALSAALGLAEAGATTEGEQHDRSL